MNTPIFDFAKRYANSGAKRLHMPGHKGESFLGCEALDLTEISGADSLYDASGIIKESEDNASSLFSCNTFYSTEGSSQCIRAMLYLATVDAKANGKKPKVLAMRNAHKVFLSAAAMLDFEVEWLYGSSYLSCNADADTVENAILTHKPTALYVTSPDYLGNVADIAALSRVCKKHGVLLLCDNAHGAYLKFLDTSLFPIDLGADMCASSAHKTLPVLTGGAYLHIASDTLAKDAKRALELFGSTSPSYLVLESLDIANSYIASGYKERLCAFIKEVDALKAELKNRGYTLYGDEPLKITLATKEYGYTGKEFASLLEKNGYVCEFCDNDFAVLMLTPENACIAELCATLVSIEKRERISTLPPSPAKCERVMSVREAAFAKCEEINASDSLGRVLASASVGCPPAIPIVAMGERIDENAIECFKYYGIEKCTVIKNADA